MLQTGRSTHCLIRESKGRPYCIPSDALKSSASTLAQPTLPPDLAPSHLPLHRILVRIVQRRIRVHDIAQAAIAYIAAKLAVLCIRLAVIHRLAHVVPAHVPREEERPCALGPHVQPHGDDNLALGGGTFFVNSKSVSRSY